LTAITVGYFGVLVWVTVRDLLQRRRANRPAVRRFEFA
jgi:hypothetical protein